MVNSSYVNLCYHCTMSKENFPHSDTPMEQFTDTRELPVYATEEQKIEEIIEQHTETRPGKELSIEDRARIAEIKKSMSVDQVIEKALENKDDGAETFQDVRSNEAPQEQRPKQKGGFLKKTALIASAFLASAFGSKDASGQQTQDGGLSMKSSSEKVQTIQSEDSLELKKITPVREKKTVGNVTIEGKYLIPYHNKSVEVCVAYFSGNEKDTSKVGAMINAMKTEGGWSPAPGNMLMEVVQENSKDFLKKIPYAMSLVSEEEGNDARSLEKFETIREVPDTLIRKNTEGKEEKIPIKRTKITTEIPSHAVYPTHTPVGANRHEAENITYSDAGYGYIFYRMRPKPTTAQYESGITQSTQ